VQETLREETPTPSPEPEEGDAPDGLYGHGKRTGVPEIDAILEAWENGDIDTLVALALLQEQECVDVVEGLGGPPECPEGVDEGTTLDVFPAAACEGYWATPESLPALFQSFVDGFDGEPYFLYAAWRADATEHTPAGWRVLFARTLEGYDPFAPQLVLNEDGEISTYWGGCNPATIQVPTDADFVLEPKDGLPERTGIPAVDNFLTIREVRDPLQMSNLVTFFDVACKTPEEAMYYAHCPAGQPSGTPVQAWPWWGCHGAFSNGGSVQQIAEFFATWEGELHSVLEFENTGSVEMFPDGANLAVIFDRPADGFAWAAVLDENGLFYGMVSGCPLTADELPGFHFPGANVLYEA
jgi:hypothetical protein